jgi:N6-adenosine-specific RNA methylase IME4
LHGCFGRRARAGAVRSEDNSGREGFSVKRYSVIYADPPWRYRDARGKLARFGGLTYPTMTLREICALPVRDIAAKDCALFMWATWPHYESAPEVIRAWGFKYKTVGFVWVKTNRNTPTNQYSFLPVDSFDEFFGQGHWTHSNTEYCLIATRGRPRPISKTVRQLIYEPLSEHSRKPEEARARIVQLMGDVPRVELFARQKAEGWDAWGNEVESDVILGGGAGLAQPPCPTAPGL